MKAVKTLRYLVVRSSEDWIDIPFDAIANVAEAVDVILINYLGAYFFLDQQELALMVEEANHYRGRCVLNRAASFDPFTQLSVWSLPMINADTVDTVLLTESQELIDNVEDLWEAYRKSDSKPEQDIPGTA